MINGTSFILNGNDNNLRMIKYLEDQEFRNWVLKTQEVSREEEVDWEKVVEGDIQAQKAKYILSALKIHFDRNQLSAEEIEDHLKAEIDKYRTTGRQRRKQVVWHTTMWRSAAVVLLLVGAFYLFQWMNRPYEVYTTGYGERMTIELADASVIQMNSNSRLVWHRKWEKEGVRKVELDGEAFFVVEKTENMPFLVNTDDITIYVTGTEFNVNSRRQRTMVYLDKGKVNVEVRNRPEEQIEMAPGEELVYIAARDEVDLKKVEEPEVISGWKEGILVFRDEPLVKVLESVSDIYGKEFVTTDSTLLSRNITTTIPLTNWEVTLTSIQLAMRLEVEEKLDTVKINSL